MDENIGIGAKLIRGNGNTNSVDFGSQYIVIDPDLYTKFTYTILSIQATSLLGPNTNLTNSLSLFKIETQNSGVITMETMVEFDFENCSQYKLKLIVDDGGNKLGGTSLNDTGTFTVNIANVNDLTVPNFGPNGEAANYALQTKGGEEITLYGTNFGPTEFKYGLTGKNCTSGINCIVVKYGPRASDTLLYTAENCYIKERKHRLHVRRFQA